MNITFECPDKLNGQLTMVIDQADYQENVRKELNDLRKRANIPGFRKGNVPAGLIKRQYGRQVTGDVVYRLLNENLFKYIRENKIQMLGEPLGSEKQQMIDFAQDGPYEFIFDIAVAPEFTVTLSKDDTVKFYNILVDDELVKRQIDMYCQQAGEMVDAEEWSGNDTLVGDLRQLDAEGNTLEGGKEVEAANIMPAYIKGEEEKAKFEGAKPGDIITFNPRKAYESDAELAGLLKIEKDEVANFEGDFTFQVTGIRHYQPAAVDQKLFDRIYGEGACNGEEEFRQRITEELRQQLLAGSDHRFFDDLQKYLDEKVGELTFPEELLKRVMKQNDENLTDEKIEEQFALTLKGLKWHLIKEQLVRLFEIKVETAEIEQVAKTMMRQQFAQYGMANVPDELLENYAKEQLQKRENVERFTDQVVDMKLTQAAKAAVTLDTKDVTLDAFNEMARGNNE